MQHFQNVFDFESFYAFILVTLNLSFDKLRFFDKCQDCNFLERIINFQKHVTFFKGGTLYETKTSLGLEDIENINPKWE